MDISLLKIKQLLLVGNFEPLYNVWTTGTIYFVSTAKFVIFGPLIYTLLKDGIISPLHRLPNQRIFCLYMALDGLKNKNEDIHP